MKRKVQNKPTPTGKSGKNISVYAQYLRDVKQHPLLSKTEEEKNKNDEEASKEKVKMRKFLREKDLKKHLKGKKSFGEEDPKPKAKKKI